MNTALSTALHPLSFELGRQLAGSASRQALQTHWRKQHGGWAEPPATRLLAEHPLIASHALQTAIDQHLEQLLAFMAPRYTNEASREGMRNWPRVGAPDVVSADLAIVEDPSAPQGWSLRWVEFQAFTSIISAMYTLHVGASALWPQTRDLTAWTLPAGASDWRNSVRQWAAPQGGILLEQNCNQQVSRFDLQAAAHFLGLNIVDPIQLRQMSSQLYYKDVHGMHYEINHVFNRLVMHELDTNRGYGAREQFERLAGRSDATWHSHPAWYYGLSKEWLADLPQAQGLQCASAANWRQLGLPAEALVAKNIHSHGGAAVRLNVTEKDLDDLKTPSHWIVQPRYAPQALFKASDGQPIYGEIRCVLALPKNKEPWVPMQFARLTRGTKASVSTLAEAPGGGLALLYRPPGA